MFHSFSRFYEHSIARPVASRLCDDCLARKRSLTGEATRPVGFISDDLLTSFIYVMAMLIGAVLSAMGVTQ